MSFGYSVGDAVALVQLAWKTLQGVRQACGEHEELISEVSSLHRVLLRLQRELANPDSLLNRAIDDRRQELNEFGSGCERILNVMNSVVTKYNALSEEKRSGKKLWQQIKFANGEVMGLAELRLKLLAHTSAILMSLNLCSLSSQGRVEKQLNNVGGDLEGIRDKVDWIAANMTARTGDGTIWTSYEDDDRSFWRELRRGLVGEGYCSSVLRKHKHLIKEYVRELGSRGVFDQADDLQVEDAKVEDMEVENVEVEDVKVEDVKIESVEVENMKLEGAKLEDEAPENLMVDQSQLAPDDTYLSYFDVQLKKEDVDSLKNDYLTVNIISFWEEYIERQNLSKFPSSNIVLLRPSMSFMLMQIEDPLALKDALPNFSKTTHIFLPVTDTRNVSNTKDCLHWSLLIISIIDGLAIHYDSLMPLNSTKAQFATHKFSILLGRPLRFINIDTPQQENSSDGGVFMCIIMRHLLLKRLLSSYVREKVSMSMNMKCVDSSGGRKELLRLIKIFRKEGQRRAWHNDNRRSADLSLKDKDQPKGLPSIDF